MFRPLPVLTLFTLPALALLIWLGAWQWGRMGEKAEAIAAWEQSDTGEALPLETALCEIRADFFGRDILPPESEGSHTLRFQGRSASGEPGWRLMSAMPVPECFGPTAGQHVLVQAGFETQRGERGEAPGMLMIEDVPEAGVFTPENLPESDEFYRFEPAQLAAVLDVPAVTTEFWLIESSAEMPPELAQVPPGQHLGYALTWWGMAIALIAVFLLMHVQRGRLRFTRR